MLHGALKENLIQLFLPTVKLRIRKPKNTVLNIHITQTLSIPQHHTAFSEKEEM